MNNEFANYQDKSYLDDTDPEFNADAHSQSGGGLITADNGIADRLLQNDKLYQHIKAGGETVGWNGSKNIKTTTRRDGNKFLIHREQFNVEYIAEQCSEYRKRAEAGFIDPLAPLMPDGKIGYKWMELPEVIAIDIGNKYFGGLPWAAIKRDRTLKAQFYRVVETEYPAFVCYPGGKLPIPVAVPYPTPMGAERFFKGHQFNE